MKWLAIQGIRVGVMMFAVGFGVSCMASPKPEKLSPPSSAMPAATQVLSLMERVADWQIAHPSKWPRDAWHQAAWYTGMMSLSRISASDRFEQAMLAMGQANVWKLAARPYHADDHAVGQTYAELYEKFKDPDMIKALQSGFDYILANPKDDNLLFEGKEKTDRWSWCDALFMAPPAWIRLWKISGDQRYLDFMVSKWWITSKYLYDPTEMLYFRDSTMFGKLEKNGKKIFWGRGNGWVLAGLARILPYLPADHPSRKDFERQFKEMSSAVIRHQAADGFWRASMLDPDSFPMKETSGTGFFCFALAWGINNGLLDRSVYEKPCLVAWNAIASCVTPEGKLRYVQPVGFAPVSFDPESTEVYGTGALLLAGSEIYRMTKQSTGK